MKRTTRAYGAMALGLAAVLLVSACGDDGDKGNSGELTVTDTVSSTAGLETLTSALEAAGLDVTLAGEGPFTVFAPTDAAFAALPAGALDALLADKDALSAVLLGHVVSGSLDAAAVVSRTSLTTVGGAVLTVEVVGADVFVGGAKVTATDIMASNGIIHVIDAVLLPPAEGPGTIVEVATEAGGFTTLLTAVEAAGLVDTLNGAGPFTVFAPTDAAFAALPAGTLEAVLADKALLTKILTYHVVSGAVPASEVVTKTTITTLAGLDLTVEVVGADVFVGGAKVTATDIMASNGIIHVIDAVLLPPAEGPGTIVEVATEAGGFTTLLTAVEAAGLVDTLNGAGPFTVFAPTDAAFAALPAGTLEAVLADKALLTKILTYHVVAGAVPASEVVTKTTITTLAGLDLTVEVVGADVFVGGAKVTATDIMASNGIIHVIDAVLLPPAEGPGTIVEVATEAGGFTTLLTAVEAAGLVDTLNGAGPFTVFAPTDAAFAALPEGTLEAVLADKDLLTKILTYHVVSGAVPASEVVTKTTITTLAGLDLTVEVVGADVFVGGAKVTATDIMASNGIIHVIDAVLLPPAEGPGTIVEVATEAGGFTTLLTAVEAAGLVDTLNGAGPFTVFAPTDAAFAALPEGTLEAVLADKALLTKILTYHVVSGAVPASEVVTKTTITTLAGLDLTVEVVGSDVFVGGAKVTATDIMASNGIIHVIDAVLLPPAEGPGTIVEVATEAGGFTTLLTAVEAAGLVDTLNGAGPFTVFAPTDAAFAALPAGTLEAVLADKALLTKILTYHVVAGAVPASEVVTKTTITTLAGLDLTVEVVGADVFVGGAKVTATDIMASNGIIHVIDAVLLPPAEGPGTIVEVATEAGGFTTLLTAVEAAGLVDTLNGAGPFTVFAPTDAAFAALPEGTLEAVLADKDLLTKILTYHVVAGAVPASEVVTKTTITTLAGLDLTVEVVGADVFVGGAKVTATDIMASNGIIHVIDAVLLPPEEGPGTIVEVATEAGGFTTLLTAVEAAGLVDTLNGAGPFTVFAPTDAAFAALPEGTLEAVLADKDLLTKILTYHVVAGAVPASEVVTKTTITTLAGLDLTVEVVGADVFVGGAKVTATDIMASNGIIHVIDAVLLPPAEMQ
jgi:uncharacterized surface protein with fasciclin (FAS1) repeats